jgi:hypothetical protein
VPVEIKSALERRQLRFTSFDEVLADAEKLASSSETRMLGNWQLGQLLAHLAWTVDSSIDGIHFQGAWYLRIVGYFIKGRVIRNGLPTGIKLGKDVEADAFPPTSSSREGLEALRKAVDRMKAEKMTARHPVLGKMTHEEWMQIHLRHCELHLSFAVPNG